MWECKEPRAVITTLKNKVGGFIQPNINTYYKALGIKILWY